MAIDEKTSLMEEEKKSRIPKGGGWGIGYGIGFTIGIIFGILMDNIAIGIAIGVAIGAGIGASIEGSRKKTTLTPKEKKIQKISLVIAFILLIVGILVFLWFYLS